MTRDSVVQRVRLVNFKAFEDFSTTFGPSAVLVGPNNAGKSTLISAIKATSKMLDHALSRKATRGVQDGGRSTVGHDLVADRYGLVDENLRHEFRDTATRIEVVYRSQARLTAVWPAVAGDEPAEPFFYVHADDMPPIGTPALARKILPTVSAVPILTPLEHSENLLTDSYVQKNADGRLASRHFRNQLWLLRQTPVAHGVTAYDNYVRFVHEWTPELRLTALNLSSGDQGTEIDLYYRERGARTEREVFWAGDGMQVWLQLLLHLHRSASSSTDAVVLDEPDVFLHADLQRRLVRLLTTFDGQVITASHSAEVVAEADPDEVVWVEKSRRRSIRGPRPEQLGGMSASLGTGFNLRLARALRSTVVVFVEGADMRILRHLAATAGAQRLATEAGVAVVPLQGFSNWEHVEPFSWMSREFLDESVRIYVLLDRDYRTLEASRRVEDRLAMSGAIGHVWQAKEIENYLVVPDAISRLSGATIEEVERTLDSVTKRLRAKVFSRLLHEKQMESPSGRHNVSITDEFQADFDRQWSDREFRLRVCPGKEMLAGVNRMLQLSEFRSPSVLDLARRIRVREIDDEVLAVLRQINDSLEVEDGRRPST